MDLGPRWGLASDLVHLSAAYLQIPPRRWLGGHSPRQAHMPGAAGPHP